jgi:hypothetical protein
LQIIGYEVVFQLLYPYIYPDNSGAQLSAQSASEALNLVRILVLLWVSEDTQNVK